MKALGAGLHIHFSAAPDGASGHLKIAQPSRAQAGPTTIVIPNAAYVQWFSKKLPRAGDASARTITLRADEIKDTAQSH